MPSGTLELVVNLDDDEVRVDRGPERLRLSGAVVSGAYGRFFVIDTHMHASMVGVHFRPGGAAAFLGVAPGDLADRHVDLEALWGRAALGLREKLCAASADAERFALLEDALISRLDARLGGHPAVPIAVRQLTRPGATVGDVAAAVDLSRRRLIDVVTAEVGMGPKRLSRVMRFQRAAALARRSAAPDWAGLAAVCGYFDQSHLNHDVREFTGTSPTRLAAASAQVKDLHVAVDEGAHFSKTGVAPDRSVWA